MLNYTDNPLKMAAIEQLDEAIGLQREALEWSPPHHIYRVSNLAYLALFLVTHYDEAGATESLEESIKLYQQALALIPDGHQDRRKCIQGLADAVSRFAALADSKEANCLKSELADSNL